MINNYTVNLFIFISAGLLAGCTTNNQQAPGQTTAVVENWVPITAATINALEVENKDGYILINGNKYYQDDDGSLFLKTSDIQTLKNSGVKIYNPAPISGVKLDKEELTAYMQDGDAMFAFLKNPNFRSADEVSFVVKKGGLKENFARLAELHGIKNFRWELDYSFYIPNTKIIVAKDIADLIDIMSTSFPIEISFDNTSSHSLLRVYAIDAQSKNIAFTMKKGSLKDNFARLSELAGWEDKWMFEYDFQVPETRVIRGGSFNDLLDTMLKVHKFPIVAETNNQTNAVGK